MWTSLPPRHDTPGEPVSRQPGDPPVTSSPAEGGQTASSRRQTLRQSEPFCLVLALLPFRASGWLLVACRPREAHLTTRAASLAVPALLLSVAAGLATARTLPDWLATTLRVAPLAVFVG